VISRDRVAVAVLGAVCFAGIAVVVLTSGLHQSRLEIVFETTCLLVWFAAMLLLSRKTASATYELADSRDVYQRAVLQGQKLNALGKLAGSIENNFNNALMSIDYSLHLLSESLVDSQLGPELDDMHQTVVRSKALSKKLERLGHGDAETIELVEVDVAVEALARSLRRLTGSSTLTLSLGAPKSHILCDANQLDQVLVNLVVNSRDAMPAGGEITISTTVSDDRVMIAVRDSGSGIAPDVLDHIFEPFYTTKGPDSGTGLGLWICSSIASGCGGELTAESVVGQGTTMTLRLPLANRNARSATTRAKVTSRPLQLARKTSARTQHSRVVDWFVGDIVNPRLRVWGVVLVMISLASVPIWALFAGLQLDAYGPTPIAITLLAGGALSLVTPLLVRVTRSPELAAFSFAGVLSTAICAIAILSGGFRIEVLIWMTLIPILGAQQREFRYFTRFWSVVVVAQIAVVAILALAGAITLPAMAPEMLANEQLAILLSLLAVLAFGFIAAARVGAHFARERDDYAATLVKSQDFQMLGTIASSIAHDLNNILTTLEFGIEIIREEIAADAPAAAHLDELQLATAQIQDLARQLTRFGRSNTDGANVVPDVALSSLAKMLGPIVGSHVKVSMNLDAGSSTVRVRSCELDQLIINLALNARDAMPDGGELRISSAVVGNAVEITVSDQGIGIPQPLLARVCEPFFTTSDDRVGLGLWVCREIVQEAHGKLVVESSVGRGTTIRLIIPRVARASDAIRRAQRSGGFTNPLPAAIELAKSTTPSTRIRRET
jgi:signal transduction histidine kinase